MNMRKISLLIVIAFMVGCTDSTFKDIRKPENKELEIVGEGYSWSAYKIKVDSSEYIIVSKSASEGGIAIIKHK